jgi:rSAM/selenodomain-associated transferase 2
MVRDIASGHRYEILVVDGHPAATTLDVVTDRNCILLKSPKGRAHQMNRGAQTAKGRILVFLHVDCGLPVGALDKIRRVLADQSVVAGAFDLGVDSSHPFIRFMCVTSSWRARVSRVPYGDQAIFTTKEYFQAIGGFAPIPIMEDVELMKRIKTNGHKIEILPDEVISSARRWQEEGIIRAWLRNHKLRIRYFFGAPPENLVRHYPDIRRSTGTDHDT